MIAGISVSARSGVSSPLGSLRIDRVGAERHQFLDLAGVVIVGVDRAHRIDDAGIDIEPGLFCRAHRHFHVAHVVERVIGRVIADAVGEDALGGQRDDVVGKELEGEQALPARHHDKRRLFDPGAEDAHALPWVLAQVAHADVEHRAADEIDGLETGAVEHRRDFRHHGGRHARRPQALVRVAQRDVDEWNRSPVAHQSAVIWKFSSIQRVWTSACANSGHRNNCSWKDGMVCGPAVRRIGVG